MFFLFSEGVLYISCQVVAEIPCYPSAYIVIYKRKRKDSACIIRDCLPTPLLLAPTVYSSVPAHPGTRAASVSVAVSTPGVRNSGSSNCLI